MKKTEFIKMIVEEPLRKEQISLLDEKECFSLSDCIEKKLNLKFDEVEVAVKEGYDPIYIYSGLDLVGVIHEPEEDFAGEDVRWGAGYHAEVEIRKGNEYWFLYDLGSCYD